MTIRIPLAVLLATLAASLPPARADEPPPGRTDPSCQWQWLKGDGLALWAESCPFDTGHWHVRFAPEGPGFMLYVNDEPQRLVLQRFAVPAGEPLATLLPTLRQRGLIADSEDCVFQPAALRPTPRTIQQFEIRPTGETLKRFEATPSDEVPEPPCGDYGWSTHGVRYFQTDLRHPGTVIYIDLGQDGTFIAPETLVVD